MHSQISVSYADTINDLALRAKGWKTQAQASARWPRCLETLVRIGDMIRNVNHDVADAAAFLAAELNRSPLPAMDKADAERVLARIRLVARGGRPDGRR
jgi:hypothetical protein